MNCIICGSSDWRRLPAPHDEQSMTTSGIVMPESLRREQCMNCGLLRKAEGNFLGNSNFYEERYENYYRRPGAEHYDHERYAAMAAWMKSALGPLEPDTILEIGCGTSWSMVATASLYAGARIEDIEPSREERD